MSAGKRKWDQIAGLTDGDPDTLNLVAQGSGQRKKIRSVRATGGLTASVIDNVVVIDGNGAPGVIEINQGAGITCVPNPITGIGTVSITDTGITPSNYRYPSLVTANAQGQITGITAGTGQPNVGQWYSGIAANPASFFFSYIAGVLKVNVTDAHGQSWAGLFNDPSTKYGEWTVTLRRNFDLPTGNLWTATGTCSTVDASRLIINIATSSGSDPSLFALNSLCDICLQPVGDVELPVATKPGDMFVLDSANAPAWTAPLNCIYELEVNPSLTPAAGFAYVDNLTTYTTIRFGATDVNGVDTLGMIYDANPFGPGFGGYNRARIGYYLQCEGSAACFYDSGDLFRPLSTRIYLEALVAGGIFNPLTAGPIRVLFTVLPPTPREIAPQTFWANNDLVTTQVPYEVSATQATAMLDTFATAATTKGLVAGSNNLGPTYYLNGNNAWSVPPAVAAPIAPGQVYTSNGTTPTWMWPPCFNYIIAVNVSLTPPSGYVYVDDLVTYTEMRFSSLDLTGGASPTLCFGNAISTNAPMQFLYGGPAATVNDRATPSIGGSGVLYLNGFIYNYPLTAGQTSFVFSPETKPGTVISVASGSGLDGGPITSSGTLTLAAIPANTILANNTAGALIPTGKTGTEITAMLDTFTAGLSGVCTPSGGGASNFLRADGVWSAPPGTASGTVTSVATGLGLTGGTITTSGTLAVTNLATHGFTAQTTYSRGDTLYSSSTNVLSRLAIGLPGQSLGSTSVASVPIWFDPIRPNYSSLITCTTGSTVYATFQEGVFNSGTNSGGIIFSGSWTIARVQQITGAASLDTATGQTVINPMNSGATTSGTVVISIGYVTLVNGSAFVSNTNTTITAATLTTNPNTIASPSWSNSSWNLTADRIPVMRIVNTLVGAGSTVTICARILENSPNI